MARGTAKAETVGEQEAPPAVEAPQGGEQPPAADGAIPPEDHDPDSTPGVDVGAIDADTGFADSEPEPEPIAEGDVTVIVAITIGGTRNGEQWPAVGEPITLPAAEAAGYLKFGYVRIPDAE